MIDRVPLRTGAGPVPSPMATPLVRAAASGGASVLVALLNALIGPDRPSPAPAALALLSAVLGLCARFTAAPGIAALTRPLHARAAYRRVTTGVAGATDTGS
ncbi:hypothetical protein [Streptomyces sp. STR69]|uniref:hypothetical protein n=1 Tax=Streptomyces sp. STR69 TaxID=1796942 RepID=UPI0021C64205|nr:hypothetical protein [Streptomyces sp. STR69]